MIFFLKILLAHLVGDFLLQPYAWVKDKEKHKVKSPKLYLHVALHGVLTYLVLWDFTLWPAALAVLISHFLIDATKLTFQKEHSKRTWFFVDQGLHLVALLFIAGYWGELQFYVHEEWEPTILLYFTALFWLTAPSSIFVKVAISRWSPSGENNDSLDKAGKYIGILERIFVFAFVVTNHWSAIGFLLVAKAIFRFGNLQQAQDRNLTAYILIGTLFSFAIAFFTGLAVLLLRHTSLI